MVKNSRSIAVILQYPAEALAAAYSASGLLLANFFRLEEEDVTFPLVVSFRMEMIDEFG